MRSQQDLIIGPVEGYKMVNADLTCRTFQFEIGKRHKLPNNDPLELCKNGFHFCQYPSGVWSYYSEGRLFKIKAYGVLVQKQEPGADYKLVCEEIELCEEVKIGGDWNTGNRNTGDWNTGNRNTGDCNTGNRNTGNRNTGGCNTGNRNTGDWNTGNRNIGNWNTGDWNTGNWNVGDYHSGSLNFGEAPLYLFNKICKMPRNEVPWSLVNQLGLLLLEDVEIDPTEFLTIPNATPKAIKALHNAFKVARARRAK